MASDSKAWLAMDRGDVETLVGVLNSRGADLRALELAVKVAHWNVKGGNFSSVHPFYDALAEHLADWVDLAAERAVTIGGVATGTVQDVAAGSILAAYPGGLTKADAQIAALTERYAVAARAVREAMASGDELGDPTTTDLFTEISRGLERDLWMLSAHLQG